MLLSLVYRLMRCLIGQLAVLVRSDLSKDAELLVLRHENQVLRRQLAGRLRWDHADRVFITRHNLAHWTGRPGGAAEARDQCAALFPIREPIQGPEHPGAQATRHNLAVWTKEAGNATLIPAD